MKTIFLYKMLKKHRINGFAAGNIYFSCCAKWIEIGKDNKIKGQGDIHEGVFAKYKRENSQQPLQYYTNLFKDDLIAEEEEEYILFRRKSSLYTPAICFYTLDEESINDALPDDEREHINKTLIENDGKQEITIDFPIRISEKYISEYTKESNEYDAVTIRASSLLNKFKEKGIQYYKVTYIDTSSEFDIFKDGRYKKYYSNLDEAINNHVDILFKDEKDYRHQYELRAIINNEIFNESNPGKTLELDGLSYLIIQPGKETKNNYNSYDIYCYTKDTEMTCAFVLEKK